jgi:hypothetical protein
LQDNVQWLQDNVQWSQVNVQWLQETVNYNHCPAIGFALSVMIKILHYYIQMIQQWYKHAERIREGVRNKGTSKTIDVKNEKI